MYAVVPRIVRKCPEPSFPYIAVEKPKSANLTLNLSSNMIFSGFKSL